MQLNRDAGYEPVHTGPLENAAAQEAILPLIIATAGSIGPFVYRTAPPELLRAA